MKRKLSGIVVLAFLLASCAYNASLVKVSYDSLTVSKQAYETAIKMTADLVRQGHINEIAVAKVKEIGAVYAKAHNAAVEALAKYRETKDVSDAEILQKQIALASGALSDLLTFIIPYMEK